MHQRVIDAYVVSLSFTYSVANEIYGGSQRHGRGPIPTTIRYDPKRPDRSWIPYTKTVNAVSVRVTGR
jgi:hypothetical protein